MLNRMADFWEKRPLASILWLSFLARLVAVIFSKGYGMHDDHFLVIEAAQSWVDGFDYNNWLPENSVTGRPTGHSFFYVGLHFILFQFLDWIQVSDPQIKMFIVRLIHALFSLLTVFFSYRITQKLAGEELARKVGLLLGLLWFFPILAVRNIVEMACIPFVMASFWMIIRRDRGMMRFVLAGICMGLAMGIRLQTYLFFGGIGLVLLFRKEWLQAVVFGLVSIFALFCSQITDLFLWGRPFAEMMEYVMYNSTHYDDYITQAWFQYFILLAGLLIPPLSLFWWYGFFREWKKHLLLFLPALIFLVFHSFYPNKQERFIMPFVPFLVILGVIGWENFKAGSAWWQARQTLDRGFQRWFWTMNLIALIFITPAYTKKSRVETMSYMQRLNDVTGILLERSGEYGCYMMPRYYMDEWAIPHVCYSKNEIGIVTDPALKAVVASSEINYCLFIEETDLETRLNHMKQLYPEMELVKKFEPSYIDKLLHFLNPRNQNENIYVYRLFPTK